MHGGTLTCGLQATAFWRHRCVRTSRATEQLWQWCSLACLQPGVASAGNSKSQAHTYTSVLLPRDPQGHNVLIFLGRCLKFPLGWGDKYKTRLSLARGKACSVSVCFRLENGEPNKLFSGWRDLFLLFSCIESSHRALEGGGGNPETPLPQERARHLYTNPPSQNRSGEACL